MSAESHTGFTCKGALSGTYGSGGDNEWASNSLGTRAWIKITLPKSSGVIRMKITNRVTGGGDEVKKARIDFDNGEQREVTKRTVCYTNTFSYSMS